MMHVQNFPNSNTPINRFRVFLPAIPIHIIHALAVGINNVRNFLSSSLKCIRINIFSPYSTDIICIGTLGYCSEIIENGHGQNRPIYPRINIHPNTHPPPSPKDPTPCRTSPCNLYILSEINFLNCTTSRTTLLLTFGGTVTA